MSRAPIRPNAAPQVAPTKPVETGLTVAEQRGIAKSELETALPDFLRTEDTSGSTGLELVKSYIRPPRLKIVQPQSAPELKDDFFEGTVLTMPSKQIIANVGMKENNRPAAESELFYFVPLFSWPEFISVNPIELRGNAPFLRDRSISPRSQLAQKCRTPALRTEPYMENGQPVIREGKPLLVRNMECLNFLVKVLYHSDDSLWEENRIMTFSKGEFVTGCKFIESIRFRRKHMYVCVFAAKTSRRENEKGNWFGFDITDPSPSINGISPWVQTIDEVEHYKSLFEEAQKFHADNAIEVDYSDTFDDGNTVDASVAPAAPTVDASGNRRF